MSVDRIPDGPDPAAETARLTDSPQPETPPRPTPEPEHPSPPDQRQPPDREPEPKRESQDEQQEPETEQRPESPGTANEPDPPAPTDSPRHPTRDAPDAEDTAEPRSRQEHAAPPPIDDQKVQAHDDVRDGDANAATETDTSPGGPDEDSSSNNTNTQEEASEAFEGADAKSASQEDQPIEEANDRNRVAQGEGTPEPTNDVSPVQDRTAPLTDKEWSEHVAEVRDGLDEARNAGLESHLVYTIDPNHQAWTKDRRTLHDSIINDLYTAARDVPNQGHAVVAGGLGGAGKTTVLNGHADIDLNNYLIINPDNFKEEMAQRGMIPEIEGLSPMESSDLVHEESSYLARQMALRAQADGKNIIWDITMSTRESTEKRISDLRTAGYSRIDGLFIEIPIEISIERTEARHREGHEKYRAGEGLGGRYLPPEIVERQEDPEWGSKNRKIFDTVKHTFNNWSIYDNSVEGRRAVLRESNTERN